MCIRDRAVHGFRWRRRAPVPLIVASRDPGHGHLPTPDAALRNRGHAAARGPADRVEHDGVDAAAGRCRVAALAWPAGKGDRACELPAATAAGVIGDSLSLIHI